MNFGSFKTINPTSSSRSLRPYTINKVKFAGCKVDEIVGTKDPTKTYKMLVTRFESENGNYEEHTFFPDERAEVRPTFTNQQGHEYQRPSTLEQTEGFIAQLLQVLSPEAYEKLLNVIDKCTTFDDLCKVVIKLTDPLKDTEVYLKLVGRNSNGSVYARIPNVMALSRKGELYTADNFLSKDEGKLAFTPYELNQQKNLANARPTNMDTVESKPDADVASLIDDL